MTEIVHQYHEVSSFSFLNKLGNIWDILRPLLNVIVTSLMPTTRPPALLKFIHALTKYSETLSYFVNDSEAVREIIICASRKTDIETLKIIMEILSNLLNYDNGVTLVPFVEVSLIAWWESLLFVFFNS
jgi:hypothetical protein